MRWIGIIAALAGCGRLGFAHDPAADGAPPDDAMVAAPAMCSSRRVATLPLSEPVRRVRATAVPEIGYAIALETDATIHVAKLDVDRDFVSFHAPFSSRYILHGIGAVDQFVFISTDLPTEPAGYLKRLEPGWDTYGSPLSGDAAMFDPPVAGSAGRAKAWAGTRGGDVIYLDEIDRDGARTGVVSDYLPATAFHASFSPSGDDVRTALDRGDGTCETFLIAIDGTTRDRRVLDGCMEPRAVGFPDGSAAILARVPGLDTYDVRWLPPGTGTPAPVLALGPNPETRIAPFNGPHVLAALSAATGGLSLLQYGPDGTVRGSFPEGPEGQEPFDLLPDALFWMVGPDLHVAEPCVR